MSKKKEEPEKNEELATEIEQAVLNDPLFAWLEKSWKIIAALVIAVFCAKYLITQWDNQKLVVARQAADVYYNVSEQYHAVESMAKLYEDEKDTAKKEELQKQLNETKGKLEASLQSLKDSEGAYQMIANLYIALLKKDQNKEEAISELENLNLMQLRKDHKISLYADLGSLVLARMYVDNDATLEKGRNLLLQLINDNSNVNTAAAILLAQISETEQEKQVAKDAINKVLSDNPEMEQYLKDEYKRIS